VSLPWPRSFATPTLRSFVYRDTTWAAQIGSEPHARQRDGKRERDSGTRLSHRGSRWGDEGREGAVLEARWD
jgi:hypothetical protein